MSKSKRISSNLLNRYEKMRILSSILWILSGASILGFGIYYREIFEIIFGVFAILYGIYNLRNKNTSLNSISRIEKNKLKLLLVLIVIYSLVNPIANIAIIYDLMKRDFVILGGFDEK